VDEAHTALLIEIRRRLQEACDDPNVKNKGGTNYRAPRVTNAITAREDDGPALVKYVTSTVRKTADSDAWNVLMEADRLDISFEDMIVNAQEPIRSLFTDDDRAFAEQSLNAQRDTIAQRRDDAEAAAVAYDKRIVAIMSTKRGEQGKPWTAEWEEKTLAGMAAKRRTTP